MYNLTIIFHAVAIKNQYNLYFHGTNVGAGYFGQINFCPLYTTALYGNYYKKC